MIFLNCLSVSIDITVILLGRNIFAYLEEHRYPQKNLLMNQNELTEIETIDEHRQQCGKQPTENEILISFVERFPDFPLCRSEPKDFFPYRLTLFTSEPTRSDLRIKLLRRAHRALKRFIRSRNESKTKSFSHFKAVLWIGIPSFDGERQVQNQLAEIWLAVKRHECY